MKLLNTVYDIIIIAVVMLVSFIVELGITILNTVWFKAHDR